MEVIHITGFMRTHLAKVNKETSWAPMRRFHSMLLQPMKSVGVKKKILHGWNEMGLNTVVI